MHPASPLLGAVLLSAAGAMAQEPEQAQAQAQADPPSRIARLSYVDGAVSLRPAGLVEWSAAPLNQPLTSGDQLWSDPGARAEIDLGAAVVRFDQNSSVSLLGLTDELVQLQVNAGSVDVIVRGMDPSGVFEVDAPYAAAGLLQPGEYRLSVEGTGTTSIAVRNGQAEAVGSAGPNVSLRTGQRGVFGASDSYAIVPMSAPDEFDQWCLQREADWANADAMAEYVSSDAVGYQDLNEYGNWQAEPDYGEVWFPGQLDADWAPYSEGHWTWISPWGWSWIDQAPWGFAPFHYGRWGFFGGRWGWVPPPPRRHALYAPALVAWVGGPGNRGAALELGGGAAVGWLPLAPGEVYVPGYGVSARYLQQVNLSNTNGLSASTISAVANNPALQSRYANRLVPRALTVVPQTAFTAGDPVRRNHIAAPAQLLSAAPSPRVLGIAPERASLSGPLALSRIAQPPATLRNRPLVTRRQPPPSPPAFELQQSAIRANGGLPLNTAQLSRLPAQPLPRIYATPTPAPPAAVSPTGAPAATAAGAAATYRSIPERAAQFHPPAELQHPEQQNEPVHAAPPSSFQAPREREVQPRPPVAPSAPAGLLVPQPQPPPAPPPPTKYGKRAPSPSDAQSRGQRPP